jgi:hypothetical protein
MFSNLNEVIAYYAEKQQRTGKIDYTITSPGTSIEEIRALEDELKIEFPPKFKQTMRHVDFCNFLGFRHFGLGWCVQTIRAHNSGEFREDLLRAGYLEIGGSSGYAVLLNLKNDEVLVDEYGTIGYIKVADDIEQFVCRAASVVEFEDWDKSLSRSAAIAVIDVYLKENHIDEGRSFWNELARGAL